MDLDGLSHPLESVGPGRHRSDLSGATSTFCEQHFLVGSCYCVQYLFLFGLSGDTTILCFECHLLVGFCYYWLYFFPPGFG